MPTAAERIEVEITPSKLAHFKAVLIEGGNVIASAVVVDRDVDGMTTVMHRGKFYSLVRKEGQIWYYSPSRLLVIETTDEPKTEPRAVPTQGKFVNALSPRSA